MKSTTHLPGASSRPQRVSDLTRAQQWLVRIMSEYQFGRIENLRIEHGQPTPDERMRIVRAVRLGSTDGGYKVPVSNNPELKQAVRDLVDQIEQLQNGMIDCLEFRHGLPFLLETTAAVKLGEAQRLSAEPGRV